MLRGNKDPPRQLKVATSSKREMRKRLISDIKNVNKIEKEIVELRGPEDTQNKLLIKSDNKVCNVGGRVVRVRATVSEIIKANPDLVANQSSIKNKVKNQLKEMSSYKVYDKDYDNLDKIIRS